MIHLDTNYLIGLLRPDSAPDAQMRRWLVSSTPVSTSAMAWGEFLCGPLTEAQANAVRALLHHVEPLTEGDARVAARLFNLGGRRRGTFPDCLIAAVAMRVDAALATCNVADFRRFESAGLILVGEGT